MYSGTEHQPDIVSIPLDTEACTHRSPLDPDVVWRTESRPSRRSEREVFGGACLTGLSPAAIMVPCFVRLLA